ncbi:hypothetical protein DKX38_023353 [Salix brachista]|uniref:C2 domain-containing protein n=1 Tax=Salix brachista TaxID=2182728 RepID=A0A5N5JME2_9ROSI|nr:hypothetical protein DKX38_023353 [Salix brachista]
MGEQLGLLKVTVVKGRKLVIRDFKTSDPYVVVKLGNQTAKTKYINSCLNPVWNEELSFSLKEPIGVLSLMNKRKYLTRTVSRQMTKWDMLTSTFNHLHLLLD